MAKKINKVKTVKKISVLNKYAKNTTIAISILTIVFSPVIFFYIYFLDRIYPNIYIDSVNLTGKTKEEALNLINPKITPPKSIILVYEKKTSEVSTKELGISLDKDKTIKRAIQLGRSGNILFDIQQIINAIKNNTNFSLQVNLDDDVLEKIVSDFAKKIDIEPQNAKFTVENEKVQNFSDAKTGLQVEKEKLKSEIIKAINNNTPDTVAINAPVKEVEPQVKTSDANNLGIKELLASGTSHFTGSIASRIYNVNLASSRINGTLIAPDEIFSFNKAVGDISSLSGYKQAYVIENGQTVLGDGGGVCQVSTTMFRAALASGLPIVERHAHAYRVRYYEEDSLPGLDATIYTPTVDLKFRNDTGNYILIQSQIDLKRLVLTFNFYGVKDGRVVNMTKPKLWGYQNAPEDQYIDDPTLPVGTIKQIDFAATGIKSEFDYTVTKNGETINHQVFYSSFKPWQAKYLRGTKI